MLPERVATSVTKLRLSHSYYRDKFIERNCIQTSAMVLARQAEYDALMKEMISEGASVEEASAEAHDVFTSSGYDLSGLYVYNSVQDMKDKEQVDLKFKTLEDKAALANYVNSYVAIKGLEKALASETPVSKGILKLAESRKLLSSILRILAMTTEEVEEEEEDEDDEDADENRVSTKITLIEFATLLMHKGKTAFIDFEQSSTLAEDAVAMLCTLTEQVSDEPR